MSKFYIDQGCLERGCACHDPRVSEGEVVYLFKVKDDEE